MKTSEQLSGKLCRRSVHQIDDRVWGRVWLQLGIEVAIKVSDQLVGIEVAINVSDQLLDILNENMLYNRGKFYVPSHEPSLD